MDNGNILRRVYATVSAKTFFKFQKRCRDEKVKLGDALTSLVTMYANGANLVKAEHIHKEIKKEVENIYLQTHSVSSE